MAKTWLLNGLPPFIARRLGLRPGYRDLSNDVFVDLCYAYFLRRAADEEGRAHYLSRLRDGADRTTILDAFIGSGEFHGAKATGMGGALHASRILWVKSLPMARTIVDLGGAARGCAQGALLVMGYPYPFDALHIVDLPLEQRHALYAEGYEVYQEPIDTPTGRVRYVYTSMTDLSRFADGSVDLVNSGQTIEHLTPEDCRRMLAEVRRILKPDGYFSVDTPNGRATRLQQEAFIDPDHKIEYRHTELLELIESVGFDCVTAKGLNLMRGSFERGVFSQDEVIENVGLFDDIEHCYLLAYVFRLRS